MPEEQVGEVIGLCQMGGEGAQWMGIAPFVKQRHLVQNLGDGTFAHSGSLAIRAAVASGANITFKLLRNSAVAMTGGQQAVGELPVDRLLALLAAEGVRKTVVTTDDPARLRRQLGGSVFKHRADIRHRDDLIDVQRELAAIDGRHRADPRPGMRGGEAAQAPPGQGGGAGAAGVHQRAGLRGLRRLRPGVQLPVRPAGGHRVRPQDPDPPVLLQPRLLLPQRRLPVVPDRHPGRPCPGHTVGPPADARPAPALPRSSAALAEPERLFGPDGFTMRITGVGGTGVVTIAQILGTAFAADGHQVRSLDQTGLAQKGGAVVSDLTVSTGPGRALRQARLRRVRPVPRL